MMKNHIRTLREQAGMTMQSLADRVGTTAPQINKLEKGERRLTIDWIHRIAQGLGVTPQAIVSFDDQPTDVGPSQELYATSQPRDMVHPAPLPLAQTGTDLIPVRSAARGGDEQTMFLQDGPIDFIRRPPSLGLARDAYAIYMVGTSMLPRFRPGQMLHVNPYKPPQSGAGVVVTKTNDCVLIKEFVRRTRDHLHLIQYNPPLSIDLAVGDIRDCHTVVGLDEP